MININLSIDNADYQYRTSFAILITLIINIELIFFLYFIFLKFHDEFNIHI